uniref:DMT family transporter n=1 Tax=Helcococcus kunzii TaxID=40091 RepID=UPI0024AD3735
SSSQFLFGSIFLIIIGYFGMPTSLIFTPKSVVLIIYASFISSIAFTLWYFILKQYKASEIAFLRLFIPFFGTFLSAIVLGENLSFSILIGLVFVILGIIIINRNKTLIEKE